MKLQDSNVKFTFQLPSTALEELASFRMPDCHVGCPRAKLMSSWLTLTAVNDKNVLEIKNNAWVTVNNDFLSRVRRFGNDFHEWRSHEWKSLPNRLTSDKKIVIHGNECIILFLTRYFMSWTHKYAKNYHRALISPLLPRAACSDRALWRHHNWSVTSCEREILVLWRHICLLSLHAQVGAKAIFTSE